MPKMLTEVMDRVVRRKINYRTSKTFRWRYLGYLSSRND